MRRNRCVLAGLKMEGEHGKEWSGLLTARKKWGPQSYTYKELNSTTNKNEFENTFFQSFQMSTHPRDHLDFSLVRSQRTQLHRAGLLTNRTAHY